MLTKIAVFADIGKKYKMNLVDELVVFLHTVFYLTQITQIYTDFSSAGVDVSKQTGFYLKENREKRDFHPQERMGFADALLSHTDHTDLNRLLCVLEQVVLSFDEFCGQFDFLWTSPFSGDVIIDCEFIVEIYKEGFTDSGALLVNGVAERVTCKPIMYIQIHQQF